jgi:NitT/TauT family transport system ATP-binding protein
MTPTPTPPPADVPLLDVDRVSIRYGSSRRNGVGAVEDVSFRVAPGERVMLLGPSGSGKSTLLKAIGGFIRPTAGAIRLHGHPITGPAPDRLLVFQEFDQLMPWKTVRQNVMFPLLHVARLSRGDAAARAEHFLRKVRLDRFADAYPHTLSGGMKQRVAIARCLAMYPQIVLMDEPFAALDALTRRRMQDELLALWRDHHFTTIFVTHSILEAVTLGSRVILLSAHPGRVINEWQVATDPVDVARQRDEIERALFGTMAAADDAMIEQGLP